MFFLQLGHGRDCVFDEMEEFVEFKDVLELCAKKKESIVTNDDKFRHVFNLMNAHDSKNRTAADIQGFLMNIGVNMSDGDAEHFVNMISNSFPDRFTDHDFVTFMAKAKLKSNKKNRKPADKKTKAGR
jgi:hypothetical protein